MMLLSSPTPATQVISPQIEQKRWEYRAVRQTSALTEEVRQFIDWLKATEVHLKEYDAIWEYLLKFPGIMKVLGVAVQATRKYFDSAPVTLEVYRDPEIDDRYLMLSVKVNAYDEAVEQRFAAAEAAYINLLAHEEGWVQLSAKMVELEDDV